MKLMVKILIISTVLLFTYFGTSYFLLNGQFTYWTSSHSCDIVESKRTNKFVASDLNKEVIVGKLIEWNKYLEIWSDKRSERKYFGILFLKP